MFKNRINQKLELQKETFLYREPFKIQSREGKYLIVNNQKILNFASNDYLGLGASISLRKKISDNFLKYGATSSSSRLVSGNYLTIIEAEKAYAKFFGYEDAIFFPSGYQANVGIISALFESSDTVLFDKHIHASSVKGLVLSGANICGYKHNSTSHLLKRLQRADSIQAAVVTESLFSVDGDLLDIQGFNSLKKEYGFFSIVDEAHSFGALGKNGAGIARTCADIAVGTFGKALGFLGAFILLPEGYKDYFFNFCSSLIYSTTLPEAHGASSIDILEVISHCEGERAHLKGISTFMKEKLIREGFSVKGDAHILAIEIGNEAKVMSLSRSLFERNFFVFSARYPTVPLGHAIMRIGMTSLHTEEDVLDFINALKEEYEK
ncbi:MAG: pyridoxal phosphate-dependent aminotransferase family protein [Desulfobacterales bacterium]|nr:pyridoxal phosphate-dependent aminotransferase family protein [Desulfobacterales bacterium]MBF0397840.1 pyridoxal phosphate-dependent aminotransferase family protein [Desulfobacterales bacterium]